MIFYSLRPPGLALRRHLPTAGQLARYTSVLAFGVGGCTPSLDEIPPPHWLGSAAEVTQQGRCDLDPGLNALGLTPTHASQLHGALLSVVDLPARSLSLVTPAGVEVARHPLSPDGPSGVLDPRNVALRFDSVLVFADAPRGGLRQLSTSWSDLGFQSLAFPPDGVAAYGDGLLISRLALQDGPASLLYHLGPGGLTGLGVAPYSHPDWRVRALANAMELSVSPSGRAVAAHRSLIPRAYVGALTPDALHDPWRSLPLPLPREARRWWGVAPSAVPDEGGEWLTPVLAGLLLPDTDDYLYLTRSGRDLPGHSEKVVLRVDGEFRYLGGIRLSMNAGFMFLDPDGPSLLLVDDGDRWFRCQVP